MLFRFYLISINTLLFCLMCIDKKRAIKNQFKKKKDKERLYGGGVNLKCRRCLLGWVPAK